MNTALVGNGTLVPDAFLSLNGGFLEVLKIVLLERKVPLLCLLCAVN